MAKKGKKSWRSIDVRRIEEQAEQDTQAERQNIDIDKLPDSELFVIDKVQDEAALSSRSLPQRRKREPKPLRCQVIINAAHAAKPVNTARTKPKPKGPAVRRDRKPALRGERLVRQGNELDLWGEPSPEEGQKAAKRSRGISGSFFKAVEVDAPGCSYNPDPEHHQDAVAQAVAVEMTKQFAEDMLPNPIKVLRLPHRDELEELLVDAEPDDEAEAEPGPEEVADGVNGFKRAPEKKTRTDRNREKRKREADVAVKAKRSLKKQRRDLDSVRQLRQDIEAEEAETAARAARKAADKQEAAKLGPPRLGRYKFEPAPLQVLLSEEVNGSMRKLKGSALLANDRFKSLQKRGIIEARQQAVKRSRRRKRVEFTPGETSEKLRAAHEETLHFLKAGRELRAAAKMQKNHKK